MCRYGINSLENRSEFSSWQNPFGHLRFSDNLGDRLRLPGEKPVNVLFDLTPDASLVFLTGNESTCSTQPRISLTSSQAQRRSKALSCFTTPKQVAHLLQGGRKSGECEPTVPRNIGGIPDSGSLETRHHRQSSESVENETSKRWVKVFHRSVQLFTLSTPNRWSMASVSPQIEEQDLRLKLQWILRIPFGLLAMLAGLFGTVYLSLGLGFFDANLVYAVAFLMESFCCRL